MDEPAVNPEANPAADAARQMAKEPRPCVLCGGTPRMVGQCVDRERGKLITFTVCKRCAKLDSVPDMVIGKLARARAAASASAAATASAHTTP